MIRVNDYKIKQLLQGVSLLGSRGNRDVLRMLLSPKYSIHTRSKPTQEYK